MYHYLIQAGLLLLLLGTVSCQTTKKQEMPVTLKISKDSVYRVDLQVKNTSDSERILYTYFWQIPGLILEVEDAQGQKVLPLPVPVPHDEKIRGSQKILQAEQSMDLHFTGLGIATEGLAGQKCRVRSKGYWQNPENEKQEVVYSDWVEIVLN